MIAPECQNRSDFIHRVDGSNRFIIFITCSCCRHIETHHENQRTEHSIFNYLLHFNHSHLFVIAVSIHAIRRQAGNIRIPTYIITKQRGYSCYNTVTKYYKLLLSKSLKGAIPVDRDGSLLFPYASVSSPSSLISFTLAMLAMDILSSRSISFTPDVTRPKVLMS